MKIEKKKIALIVLGIFLFGGLIYNLFLNDYGIHERAVLDISDKQGDSLSGVVLKVSLKEGELIPVSSKIILENAGQEYVYNLNEIISEETIEGDYYVEGKSISGSGQGYGLNGVKKIYPKVYFTLGIYQTNSGEKESDVETSENTSDVSEEKEILGNEKKDEGSSEENKQKSEEPSQNENSGKTASDEESSASEGQTKTPITGNIIDGLFRSVSTIFLQLTGTGTAEEFGSEVSGKVSFNKPFAYNIKEGQSAEILSGSIKTDSEQLDDSEVKLKIQKNIATVTTNYTIEVYGFGEEYLGEEQKIIEIDLSDLGIILEKGEFKARIISNEEEIVSLTTEIEEQKEIAENESEEIIQEKNKTEFIADDSNETISELNETKIAIEEIILNDEERKILIEKFGENISIKAVKAELIEDRIIVRYELGDYWYEPSYDSNINKDELEILMGDDRIFWLKDIAEKLSEEEIDLKNLDEYISDYSI